MPATSSGHDEVPAVGAGADVSMTSASTASPAAMTTRPACRTVRPSFCIRLRRHRRADEAADRVRRRGQAGVDRASSPGPPAAATLSVSEIAAIAPRNTSANTTPDTYERLREHAGLDQRGAAARLRATWCSANSAEHGPRRRRASLTPRRPAQLAALDERVDQQTARGGQRPGSRARRGAAPPAARSSAGRSLAADDDDERADGHVDEEDRAPAGAEQSALISTAGRRSGRASPTGPRPGRRRPTPCPSRAAGTGRGSGRRPAAA